MNFLALIYRLLRKLIGYGPALKIRQTLFRKSYIFNELDLIFNLLKNRKSGTMIDVGAHYGTSLFPYYRMGWNVLAFEPDDENRAVLESRIDTRKITLYSYGVSNKSEENVSFYKSKESSGVSGLSAFTEKHEEAGNKIKLVTLSEIIGNHDINEVTFLKIDTEGHDLFVLQGYPWHVCRPEIVMVEFEDLKTNPLDYSTYDMADYLVDKGYIVYVCEWYPIEKYGQSHSWRSFREYPCKLEDRNGWGNLIGFQNPPDKAEINRYLKIFHADPIAVQTQ